MSRKAWNGGSVEAAMENARAIRNRAISQGAALCHDCAGDGGTDDALCVRCNGAGCIVPREGLSLKPRDHDRCPTCNGGGTVNPLTAPADFFCVGTTDCPTCDGSGTATLEEYRTEKTGSH